MSDNTTRMRQEINEIPDAVDRLLTAGASRVAQTADEIRARDPRFLISVARGSSDHACSFLKYASELLLGLPMASVGPSVKSIYGVDMRCKDAVCISVSQSGQSPDIVQLTQSVTSAGAYSIAITNNTASSLADVSDATLPIHAGPELSVAATKTFVTSLVTGLWLIAQVKRDDLLLRAIHDLPDSLSAAIACDWSAVADAVDGHSLFTLGRGLSLAISNEAALKFKETCQIHAESYSAAEVLHGPVSIVDHGFPVLALSSGDATESYLAEVADELAAKGADVFATTSRAKQATVLPHVRTSHWMTDPVPVIASFYGMVESVAARRGVDPDMPRHLKKVTQTV